MSVRWVRAAVNAGDDKLLYETEGIALAVWPPAFAGQPGVILALGEYRLYVIGEDALESLATAIAAAYEVPKT